MDDRLKNAIKNFIFENPKHKDNSMIVSSLGWSWFDRCYQNNNNTYITLREEKRCPLVNPFPEFLPDDKCAKVPDYTKITSTFKIYIVYKDKTILEEEISETIYDELIEISKNRNKNIYLLDDFVEQYG